MAMTLVVSSGFAPASTTGAAKAATGDLPLIVLLGEDGADEPLYVRLPRTRAPVPGL